MLACTSVEALPGSVLWLLRLRLGRGNLVSKKALRGTAWLVVSVLSGHLNLFSGVAPRFHPCLASFVKCLFISFVSFQSECSFIYFLKMYFGWCLFWFCYF